MNPEELTKELAILKQKIAELENTRKDSSSENPGRTLKKRIMVPLCVISAMLVSVLVFAATIPNTFNTGGVVSATKFNDNFSYIVSRLWDLNGSDLTYTSGNVGIGTITPSEALEVVGNIKMGVEYISYIPPATAANTVSIVETVCSGKNIIGGACHDNNGDSAWWIGQEGGNIQVYNTGTGALECYLICASIK